MSKRNIIFIIITIFLVIVLAVFGIISGLKNNKPVDITGEYKLEKVNVDKKEIDYSNLNFYYIFNSDFTGSIIFEDVKSDFKYEIKEEDNQVFLVIKQKEKDVLTYGVIKEENGITITHDTLGSLYLKIESVPDSLKK